MNVLSSPLAGARSADVNFPRRESKNLLMVPLEFSSTRMSLHESRERRGRFQPPAARSEGDPKLVRHVASSSRSEETTIPMHWLGGGSLPPNSASSLEDGPVLVFHLLSFVCHMCWYSFAGLDLNDAIKGSLILRCSANAAIPQLLAE